MDQYKNNGANNSHSLRCGTTTLTSSSNSSRCNSRCVQQHLLAALSSTSNALSSLSSSRFYPLAGVVLLAVLHLYQNQSLMTYVTHNNRDDDSVLNHIHIHNKVIFDPLYMKYADIFDEMNFSKPFLRTYNSDIVELFHCRVPPPTSMRQKSTAMGKRKRRSHWILDFLYESDPSLDQALNKAYPLVLQASTTMSTTAADDASSTTTSVNATLLASQLLHDMRNEFFLQLLEQYLSDEGYCNYTIYRPTVDEDHTIQRQQLQQLQKEAAPLDGSKTARLVFIISAFQDFDHLVEIVRAIHQPQHYIVIHVDRHASEDYVQQIQTLTATTNQSALYRNVVLLQFGSVVYKTDSISMINLRILRWLTYDLQLDYTCAVLMDGSVYPLLSPLELSQKLYHEVLHRNRSVWLGELMSHGTQVSALLDSNGKFTTKRPKAISANLRKMRLVFTNNNHNNNNDLKLFFARRGTRGVLPKAITDHWFFKTTSGNSGVYSRALIEKLLSSDDVMELFALSKYVSFCCLEEHNWGTALSILGYAQEALESRNMFQVWGGGTGCSSSTQNAVLSENSSLCYLTADPKWNIRYNTKEDVYFRGNETLAFLRDAKERGSMFARKFRSYSNESQQLMRTIETELWVPT